MFSKILLNFIRIASIVLLAVILYANYVLYYEPTIVKTNNHSYNLDLYYQLNHLEKLIDNNVDREMQKVFPEGYVFTNVLYGLTWCNFLQNMDKKHELYKKGINQINRALTRLNSDEAKQNFDKSLPLKYGVFYRGWLNYLIGKKLELQGSNYKKDDLTFFEKNCDEIILALENSSSPYLESYKGQTWPADMVVGMASIALYDKIITPKYEKKISTWLSEVQQHLDPTTKLIPHSANYKTGKTKEHARGSSQSLILNFLIDIDTTFAINQFQKYKALFLDKLLGLPGIREYSINNDGFEDIDSGPIILGFGGVATIVGQRALAKFGEFEKSNAIRNCIELLGFSKTTNKEKLYFLGKEPMADVFIAWSNSLNSSKKEEINWRIEFQLISLIIVFGLIFVSIKGRNINNK